LMLYITKFNFTIYNYDTLVFVFFLYISTMMVEDLLL